MWLGSYQNSDVKLRNIMQHMALAKVMPLAKGMCIVQHEHWNDFMQKQF